jgi:hypothetical protein
MCALKALKSPCATLHFKLNSVSNSAHVVMHLAKYLKNDYLQYAAAADASLVSLICQ